jgi:peptidoglycan/xylan/chitin deacetylase (PgdA/CDA1 family)
VLDALESCGARATFFMLGERIEAAPGVAAAVLDAGHEVQLHGYRHARHTELEEDAIELDTRRALDALARVGVRPTRWRAPWGITTRATERVASRHGLSLVHWTIDTHDWRGDPMPTMLARVRRGLAPGAVVLMHDALGPGSLRSGCENTVELVGPLVELARSSGLCVAGALPEPSLAAAAPLPSPADLQSAGVRG